MRCVVTKQTQSRKNTLTPSDIWIIIPSFSSPPLPSPLCPLDFSLPHSQFVPKSARTAFDFLFSDKCGFSTERLILNKRRDTVESVAGMAFLLAADRVQTGSYIGLDYIIGDTGISQGRYAKNWHHYLCCWRTSWQSTLLQSSSRASLWGLSNDVNMLGS